MMSRILKYAFFCIMILFSCEETVILETDQIKPRLVVRSQLTTEMKFQIVELSLSVDFYYDQKPPAITEAAVSVTDLTTDSVYYFEHNRTGDPVNAGLYISEDPFEGLIDHTYQLEINWNGTVYLATEKMLPVTEIDSLTYRINPFEFANPGKEGFFYETLIHANEPQETMDYYFFRFYRNDSLIFAGENDVYFTDDKFFGEKISDLPAPIFYSKGDVARVEMYSITRQAFIYLNDLFNIMNNDSGMFSPPPANPRNNISNGALGYFMVSDKSAESIVIK